MPRDFLYYQDCLLILALTVDFILFVNSFALLGQQINSFPPSIQKARWNYLLLSEMFLKSQPKSQITKYFIWDTAKYILEPHKKVSCYNMESPCTLFSHSCVISGRATSGAIYNTGEQLRFSRHLKLKSNSTILSI